MLRTLPTLGFDNVESFLSCYYTTSFADKTPVKAAQEAGRIKGLPHILGELQTKASSWPAWESSGYRDAIIRSAAQLLTDEFERLTKKRYTCEEELHENVARSAHAPVNDERAITNHLFSTAGELKKTLREEVRIIWPSHLSSLLAHANNSYLTYMPSLRHWQTRTRPGSNRRAFHCCWLP